MKKYIYKVGNNPPIPLIEALAEVEETTEIIQAEIEEANELLHQCHALTDTVPAHSVLQNLLYQLFVCLRQVMDIDTIAVLLQVEGEQQLAVRATLGLEEEIAKKIRIPLGCGFAGRVAASCNALIVDDLSTVEVVSPILRYKGIQSMVGVPLLVEDQTIGVLHVGTFRPRQFHKDDVQLLQLVANQIELVINCLEISKLSINQTSEAVRDQFVLTGSRQKASRIIRNFLFHSLPPNFWELASPLRLVFDSLFTVMLRCQAFFYHFKARQILGVIPLSA
jgi:transcriptional regulator with GAF, ATPase, and Fis domain